MRTALAVRLTAAWPDWAGYAAALWSLAYGCLGLYWSLGGDGFPFAPVGLDRRSGSVLESAPVGIVAPVLATLGFAGAAAGIHLARSAHRRVALLAFGWVQAAALGLFIPDYTLLALIAFAPFLLVFAFTGVPGEQEGIGGILYWHRVNLLIMFVGGVLWAVATLAYQRRTRSACVHCGRGAASAGGASRADLLRWGRWAVLVSCLAPLPYEITRIAWFLGFPLGITDEFLRMMRDTPGMLEVGLFCAVASIGGGILTHGLIRRWGEVYPRWIWFRAGRRIPPALAIVPASIVAVVLVPAGLMNIWTGSWSAGWALNAPGVLWIVWGLALGAATALYHLRRRGACGRCGLG